MKVLHINTYDTGGAAIACIRQHLALLESGVDSNLLTLHKTKKNIPRHFPFEQFIKREQAPGLSKRIVRRLKYELITKFKGEEEYAKNIACLQTEAAKFTDYFSLIDSNYRIDLIPGVEEYDIINLHWVADFLDWKSFFSSKKVQNIVWTLHDMSPFTGGYHYSNGYNGYLDEDRDPPFLKQTFDPGFAAAQLKKKKQSIGKTKANIHIVSPSRWLKDCSQKSSLFKSYPHTCIPYSLDISTFKSLSKEFCRTVLNIPQDKKVILFVSHYLSNQRKGFSVLVEALEMLKKEDYLLCCIGNAQGIEGINNIVELGEVQDERIMAIAYNAADVFVLPTREDNLPNVVIEALCAGTAVAGFNVGGMPDMIQTGNNGYLADEIAPDSLAIAIQKVLDRKVRWTREEISSSAVQRYAPEVQARAYSNLYKSLLNT